MSSPTVNKIPTLVPSIDEVVTGMISADIIVDMLFYWYVTVICSEICEFTLFS